MEAKKNFKTLCVHEGELEDHRFKGVVSPIYMSSAYAFEDIDKKRYPRYFNTPNQEALVQKLAALEGGETALIFGSGMAAISTALLSQLKQGDHVIFQNDIYGGTRNFIKKEFPRLGIAFSFTKGLSVEDFELELQPNTKGVYLESPSNPLLKLVDLKAIASLAQSKGVWTMIDNTFASPVNQNPIALGIDIVAHSATKYLGGHSDITAGVVVSSQAIMDHVYASAINFGGSLSDMMVWMLERSIKTLALRVAAQNENALLLAEHLQDHPLIKRVHYPGLASHPDHTLAKEQMKGFGGMLSFELSAEVAVSAFCAELTLVKAAMSLAGVESTLIVPRLTSHALLTEEERTEQGISSSLIRFSCGIEAQEDLRADIDQALLKAKQ